MSDPTLHAQGAITKTLSAIAHETALAAAALIVDRLGRHGTVDTKSNPLDLVTEVDRATEALIIERLVDRRPRDGIVGEEGGSVAGTSGVDWIVDPIDGTTNFVYGLPCFSVSIAARVDGETAVAVVHAPVIGATYSATLGAGATKDGQAIRCSPITDLSQALVATGFSPDDDRRRRQGTQFAELIGEIRDLRRMGSAALDLAAVAAGQLDAYFEVGLGEWDWAAGDLIVREAGGRVIAERDPETGRAFVAAAAPHLADAFFDRLRSLGADRP